MPLNQSLRMARMCAELWVLLMGVALGSPHAAEIFSSARVAVYFSPNGGATEAVVRELTRPCFDSSPAYTPRLKCRDSLRHAFYDS